MPVHTIALFAAAVLPLVITPGPDMLFVMSQGVSGGRSAALKAVAGVLLGYAVHAVLAAMGARPSSQPLTSSSRCCDGPASAISATCRRG